MGQKLKTYSSYLFLILSPFILNLIISLVINQNIYDSKPLWTDEISYWKEAYSFAHWGTKTGYFGLYEMHPTIGAFSTHGFFVTVYYGLFAKVFSFNYGSIVLANAVFVSVAFLIVILILRPRIWQALFIGLAYLLFTPIILYTGTSMTELLNYGLLALFIACLYRLFKAKSNKEKGLFIAAAVFFATACAFYRIIYIVLLVLPLIVYCNYKINKRFFIGGAVLLVYIGLVYVVFNLFVSPYPGGVLYSVTKSASLVSAITIVFNNFIMNVCRFFDFNNGYPIEILQRYIYLLTLIFVVVNIILKRRKKRFIQTDTASIEDAIHINVFQLILLLLPLLIVFTIYDVLDWKDYRTFGPFLWSVFVVSICFKQKNAIKVNAVALLCLFLSFFIWLPENYLSGNRYSQQKHDNMAIVNEVVKYNPAAVNRFDNTMLTDSVDFELWSGVDSGIGFELIGKYNDDLNLKSKYILINLNTSIDGYTAIKMTAFGILYVRND